MDVVAGDLLFLDEQDGELSAAIADVTCRQFGVSQPKLSHVGIVFEKDGANLVFEAREKVRAVTTDEFLGLGKRACSTTRGWYWARLKPEWTPLIPKALDWIGSQIGAPYDYTFKSRSGQYSCSQLIHEGFNHANRGAALFEERPMFFGDPNDPNDTSWKTWETHFNKLGMKVPVGQPGINPLAIYRSSKVERLR